MKCEGCTIEEHWRCGMQTWCECDGSLDWGMFDPSAEEEMAHYQAMEQQLNRRGQTLTTMHKLTLSDYALTILFILALSFGVYYGLQSWLTRVSEETGARIERAGRIYQ